jgi:hypothetical protein
MELPSTEVKAGNGNGMASPDVVPSCPLNDLPAGVHDYVHKLEMRIIDLEKEKVRFTDALVNAGKFIFDNPASKMMLAAFPKEMQTKLREFFSPVKVDVGS